MSAFLFIAILGVALAPIPVKAFSSPPNVAPSAVIVSASARAASFPSLSSEGTSEPTYIVATYVIDVSAGSNGIQLEKAFFTASSTSPVSFHTAPHSSGYHTVRFSVSGVSPNADGSYTIPAGTTKRATAYAYFKTRYMFSGLYRVQLDCLALTKISSTQSNLGCVPVIAGPHIAPQLVTIFGEKFAQIHSIVSGTTPSSPGDTIAIVGDRFNVGSNKIYFIAWDGTKYVDIASTTAQSSTGKQIKVDLPLESVIGSRTNIGVQVQNPNTPVDAYYNYGRSNIVHIPMAGSLMKIVSASARLATFPCLSSDCVSEPAQIVAHYKMQWQNNGPGPARFPDLRFEARGGNSELYAPSQYHTVKRFVHGQPITDFVVPEFSATYEIDVYAYFNTRYMFSGVYTVELQEVSNPDPYNEPGIIGNRQATSTSPLTILGEKFAQIHRLIYGYYGQGPGLEIRGDRFHASNNTVYLYNTFPSTLTNPAPVYTWTNVPREQNDPGYHPPYSLQVILPKGLPRQVYYVQVQNPDTPTSEYYNYGKSNVKSVEFGTMASAPFGLSQLGQIYEVLQSLLNLLKAGN